MPDTETKLTLDEAMSRLDDKYELIYVDYRDELTTEQVESIVSGDYESLWEVLDVYEMEARSYGVKTVLEDTFTTEEWDSLTYNEQEEITLAIEERDTSDWLEQLISNTSNPLLRINCIDEDNAFSFEPVDAPQVLGKIGLEPTEQNVSVVNDTLAECSPEFSVLLGYWIVSIDLQTLYRAPDDAKILIHNPYLYLGNPFSGSGFISEKPLEGSIIVERGDLHTDKAAFGYSVGEIYGGLSASQFGCEAELADEALSVKGTDS